MSQILMRGSGRIEEIAKALREFMVGGSVSCELIASVNRKTGSGNARVMVFDKYYMRAQNRASLTVVLTADEDVITADLIGSGGGQGPVFSFSWGAESSFADEAARFLSSIGFRS